MTKPELEKRIVTGPDGQEFEVDPLRDYYCEAAPTVMPPAYSKIVEGFFDAYRYGVQWRPTPRQSNLFIISGYLSTKTLKRVIRSYEQMQNPKYVIGLGSCTINGGMYWDSYNTVKCLDNYLPVDLYIAGCMPRPEALLAGFEELKKIIRAGNAEGANKYAENFDWYKANQKKVIHDWDMPDYNW